MNYTDSDIQAIVDTQVELKTKELQNINDKLSNALTSSETKIDKAMDLLNYLNEQGLIQDEESFTTLCELKGEDIED